MTCEYFGKCGSCTLHDKDYVGQFLHKQSTAKALFSPFFAKPFEAFASAPSHYRNRAEFRIWHEVKAMDYAMNSVDKQLILIETCPKADRAINALMIPLKEHLRQEEVLRHKLFGVEFLSTQHGMLVTLIYHKKLDTLWEEAAKALEQTLDISIIGRSRGVKKVLSKDYVMESLHVKPTLMHYKLYEGAFSQPNRSVNAQMIDGAKAHLVSSECKDLLELYCGHGNFTLPLSGHFQNVLATEISKASIRAAQENCTLNSITNITFVRMRAEELTAALNHEREFVRLRDIDLDGFDFSHIFVDPPRAGMDEKSCAFAARFDTIIYISCNPTTLARDLEHLTKTHEISAFALFDQFPYTHHLESGVFLKRKH
jgi:tRNA (uracil-5-)-methyltransferase